MLMILREPSLDHDVTDCKIQVPNTHRMVSLRITFEDPWNYLGVLVLIKLLCNGFGFESTSTDFFPYPVQ